MRSKDLLPGSLVFLSLLVFSPGAPAQTTSEPPNIIVVNLDDTSPAWIPPYARRLKPDDVEDKICREYAEIHKAEGPFDLARHIDAACHSMPFLDSLAQQGQVFDHCFATSSLCSPSRAGLLTGRYQQEWGGFSIMDVVRHGIPTSIPILAENFQKAGYLCGMVGKWHVAENDPALEAQEKNELKAGVSKSNLKMAGDPSGFQSSSAPGQGPLDRGFDYYFGYNLDHSFYFRAIGLWENRQLVPQRPPGEYLTDLFADKCVGFLTNAIAQKKRFLLYFAPMAMHGRLVPPPEKYSSQFHTGIEFSDEYAGHLRGVDEALRKIYGVLQAAGQDKNTLFFFTADNGEDAGRVPPYNAPYRGGKGEGWLGGSHEPLIVYWPAQLHPAFHQQLVSTVDIFATALDAAGLAPSQPIDGRSLLPLLRGQTLASPHTQIFCAGLHSTRWADSYFDPDALEFVHKESGDAETCPLFAWVQKDHFVLTDLTTTKPGVYPQLPTGRPRQKLFYDLKADPHETTNIYATTPIVGSYDAALDNWLKTTQPPVTSHADAYQELRQMNAPVDQIKPK